MPAVSGVAEIIVTKFTTTNKKRAGRAGSFEKLETSGWRYLISNTRLTLDVMRFSPGDMSGVLALA